MHIKRGEVGRRALEDSDLVGRLKLEGFLWGLGGRVSLGAMRAVFVLDWRGCFAGVAGESLLSERQK
jgi:hypothetical protein